VRVVGPRRAEGADGALHDVTTRFYFETSHFVHTLSNEIVETLHFHF